MTGPLPFRLPRTAPPPSQEERATGSEAPAGRRRSLLSAVAGEPLSSFQDALRTAEEAALELGADALAEALGAAESLKARLWARLYAEGAPRPQEEDRLLDVDEASRRLSVSTDTLYRKARALPFTVRVGGNVRFSAQGISRFIATRQGR